MAYAKLSEVKSGDKLRADGGFTCLAEGDIVTITKYNSILYVPCACGRHYLEGQLDEKDFNTLIGFELV